MIIGYISLVVNHFRAFYEPVTLVACGKNKYLVPIITIIGCFWVVIRDHVVNMNLDLCIFQVLLYIHIFIYIGIHH